MQKSYDYNNRDKINQNYRKIKRHTLAIRNLINMLTLKFSIPTHQVISQLEPYMGKNPQNRPYSTNKSTLMGLYSIPKYLISTPTIEREKNGNIIIASFPVAYLTPNINASKTKLLNTPYFTDSNTPRLTIAQLNIIYKYNLGEYAITLHQNCFEGRIRQPVFLGRIELGDTHNTKHEVVQSTFHIHMPYDKRLDTHFYNTILSSIYHCTPEVYSNQSQVGLNIALNIAKKKFNIRNDLCDAINLKKTKASTFLQSACGKEWVDNLLDEPTTTIAFDGISSMLNSPRQSSQRNDIAKYIDSHI